MSAALMWDLVPNDRPAVPYLVGSLGFLEETDKRIDFDTRELRATGGLGVRIRLGGRAWFAPEIRVGTLAGPQVGFSIGFSP